MCCGIIYHYNFLPAEKRPTVLFSRHNLFGPLIPHGLGLALFPGISRMLFWVLILAFLIFFLSFFPLIFKVLISCFRLEIALG